MKEAEKAVTDIKLSAEEAKLFESVKESEGRLFREKFGREMRPDDDPLFFRPRCEHAAADEQGKVHTDIGGSGGGGRHSPAPDPRAEEDRAHHERGEPEQLQRGATSGLGRCRRRADNVREHDSRPECRSGERATVRLADGRHSARPRVSFWVCGR
jgi:hypothetical protein